MWLFLIVIASSIWVFVDAKNIGVRKGQIKGLGNMGPWGWFFGCLLLWIIGFPLYLAKRNEFKRANAAAPLPSAAPPIVTAGNAPPRYCSACGTPQPDLAGRFCHACGHALQA